MTRVLRNLRDCADLGIVVSLCPGEATWEPATRTIRVRPEPGSRLASRGYLSLERALDEGLAHELGHHAVATPAERAEVDWGLGRDNNRVGAVIVREVRMHGGEEVVVERVLQRPGAALPSDAAAVEAAVAAWQVARSPDSIAVPASVRARVAENPDTRARLRAAGVDPDAVLASLPELL